MMCGKMINTAGRMVPCGQCMPCRINKKRFWTGRLLLEQLHTPNSSSFVTLTYEKEPEGRNLVPNDLQNYLQRLRQKTGIGQIRFFAVGEYGENLGRPHYHAAIFGVDPGSFEKQLIDTWYSLEGDVKVPLGYVHLGDLNEKTMRYIVGYTTKKLTTPGDSRLDGRNPEFARMSKNPPLGAAGVIHIRSLLQTKAGCTALAQNEDVPSSYRVFGKEYPLGKYWRDWLRKELGITNPPVNSDWQIDYEEFTRAQEKANKIAVKLWRRKDRGAKGII